MQLTRRIDDSNALLKSWCFLFFALYPLIDFVLRHLPHLGVLSSLLEKLVMVVLGTMLLRRYAAGEPIVVPDGAAGVHRSMKWFYMYGFVLLFSGISDVITAVQGWRAVYEYAILYFLTLLLTDRRLALRIVETGTGLAGLIGLHGIYQYIIKVPIPPEWIAPGEHVRTRVSSLLESPNVLGSYAALFVPIALGLAMSSKTWGHRLFFLGCAATSFLSLIFTFTRGAWFSLFAAVIVAAALYNRKIFITAIAAAVVGGLAVTQFVPSVAHRINVLFSQQYWQQSAQDGRLARWGNAFDQARQDPLFGAGLGHYGGAVAARQFDTPYVDGYYFKTLAEMGLIGTVLLIVTLLLALHLAYRTWKHGQECKHPNRFIALGVFVGLLAVVMHNAVENIFEVPTINLMFWMFVGLIPMIVNDSKGDAQ